ncbi:MAG: chemotaxis protein CheC [Nitrospirae bacterium]|nr:chemotaxis protein CheC [Nitrospirota bacterium]MBF0590581.1 chemotaxis protein CheC [Nitrospirota bacterium]
MILTPQVYDSIREIINMGMGQSAGLLNEMFNTHITIKIPDIRVFLKEELGNTASQLWPEGVSVVWFPFSGALEGMSYILFQSNIASRLVDLLGGDTTDDSVMDLIKIGALIEVGNIVLNGVVGTMVNILNARLNYAVPDYHEAIASQLISENRLEPNAIIIMAKTCFEIKGHLINGDMLICLQPGSFDTIIKYINDMFKTYGETP